MNDIALPPYGWTAFEVAPPLSRADTLDRVNRLVNEAIAPRDGEVSSTDPWLIAPRLGWCHDYAVTKRWLLLALGFKPAELLLCECIGPDGAHHLVLRVGNVVLDNLTNVIGPIRYPVVRRQSAGKPGHLGIRCANRVASAPDSNQTIQKKMAPEGAISLVVTSYDA